VLLESAEKQDLDIATRVSPMEFFATARLVASPDQLRARITGPRLAECCNAIDRVLDWREDLDSGEIYCLWGQFEVRREPIRDGVRFTLPGCPNALAWTVTAEPEGVLVHCTINRTEHDPDFIESIETFVEDWRTGLERSDVPAAESR
jgi:hypothetical protein